MGDPYLLPRKGKQIKIANDDIGLDESHMSYLYRPLVETQHHLRDV